MDAAVAAIFTRTGWYFCNKRRTKDYTDGEVFTLLLADLSNAADFGSPWDSDVCQASPLAPIEKTLRFCQLAQLAVKIKLTGPP